MCKVIDIIWLLITKLKRINKILLLSDDQVTYEAELGTVCGKSAKLAKIDLGRPTLSFFFELKNDEIFDIRVSSRVKKMSGAKL